MPLIECPECHKSISDRADSCPHCGLPARFFFDAPENPNAIYKCDKCKDGYMIVKANSDGAFYGCTGYDAGTKSGCKNTKAIYGSQAQQSS